MEIFGEERKTMQQLTLSIKELDTVHSAVVVMRKRLECGDEEKEFLNATELQSLEDRILNQCPKFAEIHGKITNADDVEEMAKACAILSAHENENKQKFTLNLSRNDLHMMVESIEDRMERLEESGYEGDEEDYVTLADVKKSIYEQCPVFKEMREKYKNATTWGEELTNGFSYVEWVDGKY